MNVDNNQKEGQIGSGKEEISLSDKPVMIRVAGLKKKYRLGTIGFGTLQGAIRDWHEKRKDPGLKVTEEERKRSDFYALDGVDLVVHRGETIGIIGRNGAGKSTLLKILSRITAPTEGRVDLYGRITSMLEVGTGFHGDMTGRENIYLNGAILGMTRAEIDAKMEDIIRFSELEDFIDTPIKRYSSGMFVKLGFSVAYHLDSEILIMDEVLAVGDVEFQKKCIDSLMKAAGTGDRTVFYVSHNMSTVRQLCDRCIVLDRGRVIFDGDTSQAVAYYLGNTSLMPSVMEYGPEHRPDDALIRRVKLFTMEKLTLTSHPDPVFHKRDEAVLELRCRAEKDLRNVGLRFEFWYQDGTKAATSLSSGFADFSQGTSSVRIRLPMKNLVPGQYTADIVAFLYDASRNENKIDAVYPGFIFQVEAAGDDPTEYLEWNRQFWGPVRLEDLTLEKMEE